MSLSLAQAAVNDANIHFDKLYSYLIPAQLAGKVFPGSMVLVPFGLGNKARMAVVLAFTPLMTAVVAVLLSIFATVESLDVHVASVNVYVVVSVIVESGSTLYAFAANAAGTIANTMASTSSRLINLPNVRFIPAPLSICGLWQPQILCNQFTIKIKNCNQFLRKCLFYQAFQPISAHVAR